MLEILNKHFKKISFLIFLLLYVVLIPVFYTMYFHEFEYEPGYSNMELVFKSTINTVTGVVGFITLIGIFYGGLKVIMADGNKEQMSVGKKILLVSIFWLLVVFLIYEFVYFVQDQLTTTGDDELNRIVFLKI